MRYYAKCLVPWARFKEQGKKECDNMVPDADFSD